jgi:hypothetical protein
MRNVDNEPMLYLVVITNLMEGLQLPVLRALTVVDMERIDVTTVLDRTCNCHTAVHAP